MTDLVHYDPQHNIATVTINDGQASACGSAIIAVLNDALARTSGAAKMLLIKGCPGVLCAGLDLREMSKGDDARQAMLNSGVQLLFKMYRHPSRLLSPVPARHWLPAHCC